MYVNLILGAVVLVVLWLYLRKMLVRDDALSGKPADLLEKEIARRRAAEEENARAFQRVRDAGRKRMRPVVAALAEMRSAMPALAEGTQKSLDWDDDGDSVTVRVRGADAAEASLAVAWRVPDLDLREAAKYGEDMPGVFILRRSDSGREERIAGLDGCVRAITSFIVDFMA